MTDYSALPFRKRPRHHYTLEFKRKAIDQTLQPNASAAAVALALGMNANLLLRWRRDYLSGKLGKVKQTSFVPVRVSHPADANVIERESPASAKENHGDVIEILFDHIKLRIHGRPDTHTLRTVIESLRT